ncbi:MAG: hypothetical protein ACRC3Z_11155 [Phocaeicola sp.]
MKKDELKIALIEKGYESYGVTKGGEAIITFSNNSDIVTDKEDNNVDITPKNLKKTIPFVRRGSDNNLPYDIMTRIGNNITVGSNIEFKNRLIFGDSLLVYRKYRNEAGKIVKEEVLESEHPEIFEFIGNNDYDQIRHELGNDLAIFYDAFVEYIFSQEDNPKLVQIKVKESTCSRISEIDEKTGKSEYHGYSAEWHKGTPDDVIVTPLLDKQATLKDIKRRMGMIPNQEGKTEKVSDRNFVHNLKINTPGRFYYSKPYWWSVFASGWYDFSSAIPVYKKALIKNQMTLKYIVYIKTSFWDKLYKAEKATTDTERLAIRGKFLEELNNFLTGEENAGKAFVSEFSYDKIKGFEDKDIVISSVENKQIGGEYIEDSEEANNMICYAMTVHPSIVGASGKGKSINGTEARELYTMHQTMIKIFQEATLNPLYIAKAVNGWPADIYFSITNCQLTTLDKGTGATKNTGITPETKE